MNERTIIILDLGGENELLYIHNHEVNFLDTVSIHALI